MGDLWYETCMGRGPKRIAHVEHWSNPDAATYITGIDFYAHPRTCIARLNGMYEFLSLGLPANDNPLPRPQEQVDQGKGRWGHAYRDHWYDQVSRCQTSRCLPDGPRTSNQPSCTSSLWHTILS